MDDARRLSRCLAAVGVVKVSYAGRLQHATLHFVQIFLHSRLASHARSCPTSPRRCKTGASVRWAGKTFWYLRGGSVDPLPGALTPGPRVVRRVLGGRVARGRRCACVSMCRTSWAWKALRMQGETHSQPGASLLLVATYEYVRVCSDDGDGGGASCHRGPRVRRRWPDARGRVRAPR